MRFYTSATIFSNYSEVLTEDIHYYTANNRGFKLNIWRPGHWWERTSNYRQRILNLRPSELLQ